MECLMRKIQHSAQAKYPLNRIIIISMDAWRMEKHETHFKWNMNIKCGAMGSNQFTLSDRSDGLAVMMIGSRLFISNYMCIYIIHFGGGIKFSFILSFISIWKINCHSSGLGMSVFPLNILIWVPVTINYINRALRTPHITHITFLNLRFMFKCHPSIISFLDFLNNTFTQHVQQFVSNGMAKIPIALLSVNGDLI